MKHLPRKLTNNRLETRPIRPFEWVWSRVIEEPSERPPLTRVPFGICYLGAISKGLCGCFRRERREVLNLFEQPTVPYLFLLVHTCCHTCSYVYLLFPRTFSNCLLFSKIGLPIRSSYLFSMFSKIGLPIRSSYLASMYL